MESPRPRLTVIGVFAEIADELFSLDRGLPYSVWCALRSPGATARRYIEQRDPRLTRPFRLTLVMLAVCALLMHSTGGGEAFMTGLGEGLRQEAGDVSAQVFVSAMSALFARFDLVLVMCWIPAVALAFQSVFRRYGPNFAESTAFSLYALAGFLPVAVLLAVVPPLANALPLWTFPALFCVWLVWAGKGYVGADRISPLRLLWLPVLAQLLLVLVFLLVVALWAVAYSLAFWGA